jgi:ParB/RepB/Spo0J family partition protein
VKQTRESMDVTFAKILLDDIEACSFQPRVNFSVDLVRKLAESIGRGQHEPLIEVEPGAAPGRYRIVCGEQRWRAAKEAGQTRVTVRLHPRLGYLDRLERQYQENGLRKNFDPLEDASAIHLHHELLCVRRAEELLADAGVPFVPLASCDVTSREEFTDHLFGLEQLLLGNRVGVVRRGMDVVVGTLSPWRDTEQALRVSEAARKAKISLLRLPEEVQEVVRALPTEHAVQVARVSDPEQQKAIALVARDLPHDQLRLAVEHLRQDPDTTIEVALSQSTEVSVAPPLEFTDQVRLLNDLCRQLARLVGNLWPRLSGEERALVRQILAGLQDRMDAFAEEAA